MNPQLLLGFFVVFNSPSIANKQLYYAEIYLIRVIRGNAPTVAPCGSGDCKTHELQNRKKKWQRVMLLSGANVKNAVRWQGSIAAAKHSMHKSIGI